MPGISAVKTGIPFSKKGFNFSSYWATLISATVENAAPTHVVLTFPAAQSSLLATDFTVNDHTVDSISWTGAVLTIVLTAAVVYGDTVTVTFGKTGETTSATNNTLANYYVRADGSNTSPYDTPAKGATVINTVINYLRTNGDGSPVVVSIGAGTFSAAADYIWMNNANLNNITVVGASAATTIVSPPTERVIYQTVTTGATIKRLTIKPAATKEGIYCTDTANRINLVDVDFVSIPTYEAILIRNLGMELNIKRAMIYGSVYGTGSPVYYIGDSSGTLENCISVAAAGSRYVNTWTMTSSGTVNIINCNILDSSTYGININGTGTYNIKNSIIAGCYEQVTNYPLNIQAGTVNMSNTVIIANPWDADGKWVTGTYVDGGGNVFTNPNPMFKTYAKKGYIIPRIDDTGNILHAKGVADLLAAKSMSGMLALSSSVSTTADEKTALRAMIADGSMEAACHTRTHTNMTMTGKIFDVIKGAETITIDRDADTIVLSGGGTVTGFKAKTLAAIKSELEGLGATVTAAAIYDNGLKPIVLGEAIAAGSGVNQVDLLIDTTGATGYYKTEIVDAASEIESIVNGDGNVIDGHTGVAYQCRTFGATYNASSADVRTCLINIGFVAATSDAVLETRYFYTVGDFDMYAVTLMSASSITGADEATTRLMARSLAFAAAHTGLIFAVLGHTAAETSLDQWEWAIDEWSKFGDNLTVCSLQEFADAIRAAESGWTDDEDGTFSRTYANGSGDYELEATSELVGASDDGGNIGAK